MIDKRKALLNLGLVITGWRFVWSAISAWSNVEFASGKLKSVGTFFLPPGVAELAPLAGLALIAWAFYSRRDAAPGEPALPPSPPDAPPTAELQQSIENTRRELEQRTFQAAALQRDLADARGELQRRDLQAAKAEAEARERESFLRSAPVLWVTYKPGDRTSGDPAEEWESLVFSKEGDRPIRSIRVNPLVWTIKESRPVELHSVIGPLRSEPAECKFSVPSGSLPALMREMMRQFGGQAQPAIDIAYEDFDGNWFSRTFTLAIDPFNNIVWEPGPVRVAEPPAITS